MAMGEVKRQRLGRNANSKATKRKGKRKNPCAPCKPKRGGRKY